MGLFDSIAEHYDGTRFIPERSLTRVAQCIKDAIELVPTDKILEIGVGTGRVAMPFVQDNYSYCGLDISKPMLQQFMNKFEGKLPPNLTLVHGDASNMPFLDASFTHILAYHLFYFLPDLDQVMKEILRILQPGGSFIHCDEVFVNCEWMNDLNQKWYQLISEDNPVLAELLGLSDPTLSDKENAIQAILQKLTEFGYQMQLEQGATWMNAVTKESLLTYFQHRRDSFTEDMTPEQAHHTYERWKAYVNVKWPDNEVRYTRKRLFMLKIRKG